MECVKVIQKNPRSSERQLQSEFPVVPTHVVAIKNPADHISFTDERPVEHPPTFLDRLFSWMKGPPPLYSASPVTAQSALTQALLDEETAIVDEAVLHSSRTTPPEPSAVTERGEPESPLSHLRRDIKRLDVRSPDTQEYMKARAVLHAEAATACTNDFDRELHSYIAAVLKGSAPDAKRGFARLKTFVLESTLLQAYQKNSDLVRANLGKLEPGYEYAITQRFATCGLKAEVDAIVAHEKAVFRSRITAGVGGTVAMFGAESASVAVTGVASLPFILGLTGIVPAGNFASTFASFMLAENRIESLRPVYSTQLRSNLP